MATILTTRPKTVADLIDELGNIAPQRIRLHPHPGEATEAQAVEASQSGVVCELVEGTLVEKTMGAQESLVAMLLGEWLSAFIRRHKRGLLFGPDTMLRLSPGSMRAPDLSFVSWDRLPGRRVPSEPCPSLAPDLAIEILIQSNTPREMERKRDEYFAADVRMIWEIDPETRTAVEYRTDADPRTFAENDTLDGGDVLPGFTFRLADLFAVLDEHD